MTTADPSGSFAADLRGSKLPTGKPCCLRALHITGSQATIAPGLTSVVTHEAASLRVWAAAATAPPVGGWAGWPPGAAGFRPNRCMVSAPAANSTRASAIRAAIRHRDSFGRPVRPDRSRRRSNHSRIVVRSTLAQDGFSSSARSQGGFSAGMAGTSDAAGPGEAGDAAGPDEAAGVAGADEADVAAGTSGADGAGRGDGVGGGDGADGDESITCAAAGWASEPPRSAGPASAAPAGLSSPAGSVSPAVPPGPVIPGLPASSPAAAATPGIAVWVTGCSCGPAGPPASRPDGSPAGEPGMPPLITVAARPAGSARLPPSASRSTGAASAVPAGSVTPATPPGPAVPGALAHSPAAATPRIA